jgi:hypothetical protein
MDFDYEHTVTTTASPAQVWALWSDVGSWHCWDPSVQQVALEGHFSQGAAGTVVLNGGIEAPIVIEIVEPCSRYLDRLSIGDLTVRVDHQVKETAEGSEITVRTALAGPGAADLGPTVTADTPRGLEALVALAEQRSA